MTRIVIDSFKWWLANDINQWQAWSFYDSTWCQVRKNSTYIELGRQAVQRIEDTTNNLNIVAMNIRWAVDGSYKDVCMFSSNGKVLNQGSITATTTVTSATDGFTNYIEANWFYYIIGWRYIHKFTNVTTIVEAVADMWSTQSTRPVINFFWDLIIGDWNKLCRYNKDLSIVTYSAWVENQVLGWLDGTVVAITAIGTNVYIWCNNGNDTNLYIWDWQSSNNSVREVITYKDTPVRNVINLWNQHIWWASKLNNDRSTLFLWESYQPTPYILSDFPKQLTSSTLEFPENRLTIWDDGTLRTNAIESLGNIVYVPWKNKIFWFWKYFPWDKYSLTTEAKIYNNLGVYCMMVGQSQWSTWNGTNKIYLAYRGKTGGTSAWTDCNVLAEIFLWNDTSWNIVYEPSQYIESEEYLATASVQGEENVKMTIPFELTNSATSINVYVKMNRWSYSLIRSLTTTDYGVGYTNAELLYSWSWKVIQFKFELVTANTSYSPKLYTWITNESTPKWMISSPSRR